MDRASRLIARMKMPAGLSQEELLRAAWPLAVGKFIARHTRAAALEGTRLLVDVEDESWRRQLVPLEGQILSNLQGILGAQPVRNIQFRVRPPRRAPAKATVNAAPADEAEGIADPVLRRLYRQQRARSSAS